MSAERMYKWVVIAGLVMLAGCAARSDLGRLESRLAALEAENQRLNQQVREKDDSFRQLYAGQDAQFRQLMEDVRRLNGRCDEIDHRMNQDLGGLQSDLNALRESVGHASEAMETRLKRMEDYMGFEAGKEPPPNKTTGEAVLNELTDKEMYEAARQQLDQQNFDAAQKGFEGLLEKYPKSDLADNARFAVGEIYFQQGWYKKAILEYQKVIEGYPKGNKVPAAYLKQGIAFDKLGETANARLVFKELIEKFPDSNEADMAKKEIQGGP